MKSIKEIYSKTLKKYDFSPNKYNISIINNLIFSINSRKATYLKDNLFYDISIEFFRRYYFKKEIKLYLTYFIAFYEENNKIFPNYYTCLPDSKYLFDNIQKKQQLLNSIEDQTIKNKNKDNTFNTIFSSSIKNSLYNESIVPSFSVISNENEEKNLKNLIQTLRNSENENNQNIEKNKLNNNKNPKEKLKKKKTNIITTKNLSNVVIKINNYNNTNRDSKQKHKKLPANFYKKIINNSGNIKTETSRIRYKKINLIETKEKLKNLLQRNLKPKIDKSNINMSNIKNNNEISAINSNNNTISIAARYTDKTTNINNKAKNPILNTLNIKKIQNKKIIFNHHENKSNLIQNIHNIYNSIKKSSKAKKIRIKKNKKLFIKINTNRDINPLTEKSSKINIYQTIITNSNSISFNSPFHNQRVNRTKNLPIKDLSYKLKIANLIHSKKKIRLKTLSGINEITDNKESKSYIRYLNNIFKKNNKSTVNSTHKNYPKETVLNTEGRKNNISKEKIRKNSDIMEAYTIKNKNQLLYKNYTKDKIVETFQKIRHNSKYRNNLPISSLNLNLSGIKNLKSINSLYTTINIVNNYKNKKDKKSTNNSSKEAETLDSRRFQRRTKNYKIINNQNKLSISINNFKNNKKRNSSINDIDKIFSVKQIIKKARGQYEKINSFRNNKNLTKKSQK